MHTIKHNTLRKVRYMGDQFCACGSGQIRFPLTDDRGNHYGYCCTKCQDSKKRTQASTLADNYKRMKHI